MRLLMNTGKTLFWPWVFACLVFACGCSNNSDVANQKSNNTVSEAKAGSLVETESEYPVAVDVAKVGLYPKLTKSGGGYFYDDVLEYRVWIDSPNGDTYKAFASFEHAREFSDATSNAEEPLVLVFQKEHINEPETGVFEHVKAGRITEWRVEWLDGNKRTENSIPEFLLKNGN